MEKDSTIKKIENYLEPVCLETFNEVKDKITAVLVNL
jgi:hypothetical protein